MRLVLHCSRTSLMYIRSHVLMLQIANAFFKLPGDYLNPGEDDVSGIRRRMDTILAPPNENGQPGEAAWEIGDCLAQWWRPNFETFMVGDAYLKSEHILTRCVASTLTFLRISASRKKSRACI